MSEKTKENELPASWQQIQGAVWLLGIAVLAWQGWWWPGILVLVAISSLLQGALALYLNRERAAVVPETRPRQLPAVCPNCGAPVDPERVHWRGPDSASCNFCGTTIKALEESAATK